MRQPLGRVRRSVATVGVVLAGVGTVLFLFHDRPDVLCSGDLCLGTVGEPRGAVGGLLAFLGFALVLRRQRENPAIMVVLCAQHAGDRVDVRGQLGL